MPERSVLIIDDDEALIRMLRTAFQRYKFDVVLAKDGTEGFARAQENAPDLIILSVELPKGNGFLVCKDFKQSADLKEIPIILTSRKATDADFEKHRKLKIRANDYLHKPFSDEELFQKVGNVIGFALSPDEYSELEAKVHDFLEERTKLETEISEKADKIADLEAELAEARKESRKQGAESGQKGASAGSVKEVEGELKRAQKALGEAESGRDKVQAALEKVQKKLDDAEAELAGLREEQKSSQRKVREIEKSLAEKTLRVQELEGVREALEGQVKESAQSLKSAEAQVKDLSLNLKSSTAELSDIQDVVAELEGLTGVPLEELRDKASQWRTEAEKLSVLEKEAAGLRIEMQDVQKALEKESKKRGKLREVLERAIATLD